MLYFKTEKSALDASEVIDQAYTTDNLSGTQCRINARYRPKLMRQ